MRHTITAITMFTVISGLLVFAATSAADTYGTYKTTRYYSANRRYFVEVTTERRATLYRTDRGQMRREWTRVLAALPGQLLVANDGRRAVIIDRYYGNDNDPNMPVVILLNESGNEIARYLLSEVANLPRVKKTISAAHWFSDATLTSNGSYLLIDTIVAKRDPATCGHVNSFEEADECSRSVPYEQLRFATADGKLTSRTNIAARATAQRN